MTLSISLSPESEARLRERAAASGKQLVMLRTTESSRCREPSGTWAAPCGPIFVLRTKVRLGSPDLLMHNLVATHPARGPDHLGSSDVPGGSLPYGRGSVNQSCERA